MACMFPPLVLIVLIFTLSCSNGEMVPANYVFGDSLVDVGNNNHLKLSLLKANFPHNGIDYPRRKATGRFSNGKNSADFLAEKLGLATSPPYLSFSSIANKSDVISPGISFASGGAGILDGSDKTIKENLPINKQIEYYSQVYGEIVQQLGNVEAQKHLSRSLFTVVIGSNDMFGYFQSDSTLRRTNTPQQFINLLTLTLRGQLRRMYNLGARKLAFVGLGALGCSPSQRSQNKTEECNEEMNYWSRKFNEGVATLLQEMKTELKDMSYSYFNTYNVLLDYINKPSLYGFTEVKAACCGLGNLRAKVACLPIASYCSNRSNHVFWDFYHPTERASQLFINSFFDGPQQNVYPINVKQLIAM